MKETAQRAFNTYIKSVSLMKNKQIFDVKSINLEKFAESLGLATVPRVRFLERQEKKNAKKLSEQKESSPVASVEDKVPMQKDDNESSDKDEMFSVKRVDHQIEEDDDE